MTARLPPDRPTPGPLIFRCVTGDLYEIIVATDREAQAIAEVKTGMADAQAFAANPDLIEALRRAYPHVLDPHIRTFMRAAMAKAGAW